ncbi:hypothetical protein MRB53_042387 [Persea americana]|nr:hypothetical protein MRB53_042387 [Persea americana]
MLNNSSTSNDNTNLPPLSEVLSEINNANNSTTTQSNTSVTAVNPNNVTSVPNVDTMIPESKTDSDSTPSESEVSDSRSDTDSGIGGEHPDQYALDNDPDQLLDYPVEKLTEPNLRKFIAETKEGGKYPQSIGIGFEDRNDPGGTENY